MYLIFAYDEYNAGGGARDLIAARNSLSESIELVEAIGKLDISDFTQDDKWNSIEDIYYVLQRNIFHIFDIDTMKIVKWYELLDDTMTDKTDECKERNLC